MSKWTIAGIVTAVVVVLTGSHVVAYRVGKSVGKDEAEGEGVRAAA